MVVLTESPIFLGGDNRGQLRDRARILMFIETFIKRPVLTIVCSIVVLLVGLVSIPTLPVEQYPDISPVQVVVSANYIGASAEVVEKPSPLF